MKLTIIVIIFLISTINVLPNVFAETLITSTNGKVYAEDYTLLVAGKALPEENLIIRLFTPDGTIAVFDQIETNSEGVFNHVLLIWPEPSTTFPYGTYTVEVISTQQNGYSQKIDVKFTSTSELIEVPVERNVNTLVFAPETAVVRSPFRVFVQTTSDGLLIGNNPDELLSTSHIHFPDGRVESLSNSFKELHQGLFYVDFIPTIQGTYVFHVVTFSQGTSSHGSAATLVMSQDISGISNQIIKLNTVLDQTSSELDTLKTEVEGFKTTLEGASTNIDSSVQSVTSSVSNIEEASLQLNSLFLPIVGAIGIIVALQITILARRR